ncbi:protein SPA1-RELATED 3-like isoform X2 [Magnolia sinica]|uniref:protein SPA1-RELATED 3-like isoform X2 n=1 Tax=Magnolia sinica TaxID=86752 RepID=UPI00265A7357|nr:protein SPA1-RELATED 3-like isoform X2 [Magnolia sinica]
MTAVGGYHYRWVGMEGSDESGWEKSSSSRGLNACIALSSSRRLLHSNQPSNNTAHAAAASSKERGQAVPSSTDNFDNQIGSSGVCGNEIMDLNTLVMEPCDVSLRQWLDKSERSVDLLECLHIFRQIVETVNLAHSQGIVVHNVRPSCFIMSSFNRISFIESASCSSSGSDSFEDDMTSKIVGDQSSSSPSAHGPTQQRNRLEREGSSQEIAPTAASQRASEASCLRSGSAYATRLSSIEEVEERKVEEQGNAEEVEKRNKTFPLKQILVMEINWYTSPEEAAGASSSFSSDIYRLGVLLFELFCTFSSTEEKLRTMSNLRHRVLPPQLLLKWPKEASFCLWLLHPQPNTRPKMSELLQSEFLNEPRDNLEEREAAIKLREEIEEQELLLEFLLQMQQKKQEIADRLHDTISCLSSDIEEVLKQQSMLKKKGSSYTEAKKDEHTLLDKVVQPSVYPVRSEDSTALGSRKRFRPGLQIHSEEFNEHSAEVQRSDSRSENQESMLSKSHRLMKNFKKLESAYFSTRCRSFKPAGKLQHRNLAAGSIGRGSIVRTEGSSVDNLASKEGQSEGRRSGWINPFLEGLCKYLSFSKLKVRADLKQGDLLNSSNLVCSLSFDRDREFFATAGVNRKIKIFECDTILNEDRDIHYPVTEMASKSKLSSVCWNSYIKSQIASSDFEGVVQVWDVTRGQVFVELREHERRVWSVDFSLADPTKLASGSDDCAVKLWNINQAILFLQWRKHCDYQNKGKCVLCPVSS